jgi:hypothetical protein
LAAPSIEFQPGHQDMMFFPFRPLGGLCSCGSG